MPTPTIDQVKKILDTTRINKLTTSNKPPLISTKIFELSDLFDEVRISVKFELRLIEAGGITQAERLRWEALDRIESKLMRLVSRLDAIAFNALIQVDLAEFNQEIIESTQRIKQAAEKLSNIKTTINQFVVIIDFLVTTVSDITTGGAFSISGLFDNLDKLLKDLGIADLPAPQDLQ